MTNDFLWKKLEISDFNVLKSFYENYEFSSCDFNPVNTILFAKKYSTSICSKNGILYRFLNSKDKTRNGFLFPVCKDLKNDKIKERPSGKFICLDGLSFISEASAPAGAQPRSKASWVVSS